MAEADRTIPVVLVSGFLGSGKTTLLNHLLRNNRGIRIGVVVNDFGSINIDSMMVAGQVDSMVSLGNGCLCCAVDVEELDAMFDVLAGSKSALDVIVVEASGLAEPRNLIRMVLASDNPRVSYGGLVGVVDAVEFASTRAEHPELDQHVQLADLVVLNKADVPSPDALSNIESLVRGIVADTPVLTTDHGRVDAELLFDVPERVQDPTQPRQMSFDEILLDDDDDDHDHDSHGDQDDHAHHLHAKYSTTSFESDEPFDPRRFVDLVENPAGDVYRIKGFVHFDVPGYRERYEVNTVGRHITMTPAEWGDDTTRMTRLVLIGTDLDEELAEIRLLDCVRRPGDLADESAMLPVHRYVRSG